MSSLPTSPKFRALSLRPPDPLDLLEKPLQGVIQAFRAYLYLPDFDPVLVVLAAVAANLMLGDPVWILIIGPPGCGKTELLMSLASLPDIHMPSTLTEAGLLSGTPTKEATRDSDGGLLRKVGSFGIAVVKDFTSLLSTKHEALVATLAALREVFDGQWTRRLGSDGGRALEWKGKLGFIAGCTPAVEKCYSLMASFGERFLYYRYPITDGERQAEIALSDGEGSSAARADVKFAVQRFFAGTTLMSRPPILTDGQKARVVSLAALTARARSAVERDTRNHDIYHVPEPEAPARLAKSLSSLLAAQIAIGVNCERAEDIVWKIAFDSIPVVRKKALEALLQADDGISNSELIARIGVSRSVTDRALEDLEKHDLVTSSFIEKEKVWTPSARATRLYSQSRE